MQQPGEGLVAGQRAMAVYNKITDPEDFVINFGKTLFDSGMFGCKNIDQGRTLALTCLTEGVSPFRIKQRYHLIAGNFSMRADAMLAGLVKIGGTYRIKRRTVDNASIEITVLRPPPGGGEAQVETETFSLSWKDAQVEPFPYETDNKGRPTTTLKKNWRTPRARMQMLWARVVSDGVRTMAPQVVVGSYTPEELVDVLDLNPDGYDVIESPPDVSDDGELIPPAEEGEAVDAEVESGDGKPVTESSSDAPEEGQEETPAYSMAKPDVPEPTPPVEPQAPGPEAPSDSTDEAPPPDTSPGKTSPEGDAPEPPPFAPPETPDAEPVPLATDDQRSEMLKYVQRMEIPGVRWKRDILGRYGVDRAQKLTTEQAQEVLDKLAEVSKRHGDDHIAIMKELDNWTAIALEGKPSEAGPSN